MKIHLVWPISANYDMINMSKILIKSAKNINCYFTILVQKKDYTKAAKSLENIAEILVYEAPEVFADPWMWTPKWDVKPKGDIILGLDADVFIFNKNELLNFINIAYEEKKICGTMAYEAPFSKSSWQKLFLKYNFFDDFKYKCDKYNQSAPYYINNGAVLVPIDFIEIFRYYHKKWLFELNKNLNNFFYISQIATTFAIKDSKLPHKLLSKNFNFLETRSDYDENNYDYKKIAIFHYNKTKYNFKNIETIQNNFLRNSLVKLFPKIIL